MRRRQRSWWVDPEVPYSNAEAAQRAGALFLGVVIFILACIAMLLVAWLVFKLYDYVFTSPT